MGGLFPQKIIIWACEDCAMIYHNEVLFCPDCYTPMQRRTFENMSSLARYQLNIEMEQYRHALARRMPGMTITRDDAMLFHSFEHRNECILFARCCEADPVTTGRPSPVGQKSADERRLEFVRWMRENKGAFTEFPIEGY